MEIINAPWTIRNLQFSYDNMNFNASNQKWNIPIFQGDFEVSTFVETNILISYFKKMHCYLNFFLIYRILFPIILQFGFLCAWNVKLYSYQGHICRTWVFVWHPGHCCMHPFCLLQHPKRLHSFSKIGFVLFARLRKLMRFRCQKEAKNALSQNAFRHFHDVHATSVGHIALFIRYTHMHTNIHKYPPTCHLDQP